MEKYKLIEDIYLVDKGLWIEKQKILALADLHIGYEGYLAEEQGILLPRKLFEITKKEISFLINFLQPKKIIINGDLKHEFGKISKQEWKETLAILDLMLEKTKVILVKGNHDTILEPIAKRKNLKVVDYYFIKRDKICFMHGHKIFNDAIKNSEILVFGHTHPAIVLREGIKTERYKCWLYGKWKGKRVIVMPSFIPYSEGVDVQSYHFEQVFLKNIKSYEVFVIGDRIYKIGKLEDLNF